MSSSNFQDTILGEATRMAVEDVAAQLIAQAGRVEATVVKVEGLIADVAGDQVILNVGKTAGVSVGMLLAVERVSREVKDPATGKVLRRITSAIGELHVVEVDDGSAVARVVSGSGFKVGDVARSK